MKRIALLGLALFLLFVLILVNLPLSGEHWRMSDFANTFYRVGQNLFWGNNVYLSAYPHPTNERNYPPFAPIWVWYAFMTFAAYPLPVAQTMRLVLDVLGLPFMVYLTVRWARLYDLRKVLLLGLAPWLIIQVESGQITPLVFIGVLLCYWGVRRASPAITAMGLWLVLIKFTLVSLIIGATVLFAWRRKILGRTLAILGTLIVIASLPHPTWWLDLGQLYYERLTHPRLADSVLLLPGYPWAQLSLLIFAALAFLIYFWRSNVMQPSRWLWAMLVGVSLVGALHTFVYDWQLLMLPLALLFQSRLGIGLTIVLYLYVK
jgi:hypothetical protein